MVLVAAVRDYINRMLQDISGMKVLILDSQTEFYADFIAIDAFHFTLNMSSNHQYMLLAVVDPSSLQRYCDRVVHVIAAVFLALKQKPLIRYSGTSDITKGIEHETYKNGNVSIIAYS
ncbi:hypothetical protein SLE2022_347830 [Rubroshorea leprosula]